MSKVNPCQQRILQTMCPCVEFKPNSLKPLLCENCVHLGTHFQLSDPPPRTSPFLTKKFSKCKDKIKTCMEKLNLKEMKEFQREAIKAFLEGKDVFVVQQTGSGKSLCYEIPAMLFRKTTIVVLPKIALLQDKAKIAQEREIRHVAIKGKMTPEAKEEAEDKLLDRNITFLFIIPEMLAQKWVTDVLDELYEDQIARLVFDEADFMANTNTTFRNNAVTAVLSFLSRYPRVPIMVLTPNSESRAHEQIKLRLNLQNPVLVQNLIPARPNFSYFAEFVPKNEIFEKVANLITKKHKREFGLVFCQTVKTCRSLANFLRKRDVLASDYYRNAPNKAEKLQNLQNGVLRVLVATSSLDRGVDFTNTSFVIHVGFPLTVEQYYQETGRVGRVQQPSCAYILWNFFHRDTNVRLMLRDESPYKIYLQPIMDFVINDGDCRHTLFTNGEGEACETRCDNCLSKSNNRTDILQIAKSILSVVYKLRKMETSVALVIKILQGRRTAVTKDYDALVEFGHAKEYVAHDLKKIVCKLISMEFLLEKLQLINFITNDPECGIIKWTVRTGPKSTNVESLQSLYVHREPKKKKGRKSKRKKGENNSDSEEEGEEEGEREGEEEGEEEEEDEEGEEEEGEGEGGEGDEEGEEDEEEGEEGGDEEETDEEEEKLRQEKGKAKRKRVGGFDREEEGESGSDGDSESDREEKEIKKGKGKRKEKRGNIGTESEEEEKEQLKDNRKHKKSSNKESTRKGEKEDKRKGEKEDKRKGEKEDTRKGEKEDKRKEKGTKQKKVKERREEGESEGSNNKAKKKERKTKRHNKAEDKNYKSWEKREREENERKKQKKENRSHKERTNKKDKGKRHSENQSTDSDEGEGIEKRKRKKAVKRKNKDKEGEITSAKKKNRVTREEGGKKAQEKIQKGRGKEPKRRGKENAKEKINGIEVIEIIDTEDEKEKPIIRQVKEESEEEIWEYSQVHKKVKQEQEERIEEREERGWEEEEGEAIHIEESEGEEKEVDVSFEKYEVARKKKRTKGTQEGTKDGAERKKKKKRKKERENKEKGKSKETPKDKGEGVGEGERDSERGKKEEHISITFGDSDSDWCK